LGIGKSGFSGQQHDYLIKTMTDFRSGARGNNPGMSDLMKATSLDAIAALAQSSFNKNWAELCP
jgi:cytochrome c553